MNIEFIENKNLELKKEYTDNLLKSISAFSNYDGGIIIIGVDESNKQVVGVSDYINTKMKIENKINDTITPRPRYDINVILKNNQYILEVIVYAGINTPYLYKGIAYQRHDTSTLPVDQESLIELSLKGKNITYDQLEVDENNLTFNVLEKKIRQVKPIKQFDNDILITLGLITNNKYNVAGKLLADNSDYEFGVDMVRFGNSISVFLDRKTLSKISILTQYDEALSMFEKHFPEVEVVEGLKRVKKTAIPYEAFREAVANAIAHRNYRINAPIKIEMFDNRIEIISPGGLPQGMTEENYLKDNLSILRNKTISNVMHTLEIIERFGTGIRRINNAYIEYERKPKFIIKDTYIKVILPNLLFDDKNMNEKTRILNLLDINVEITRQDIESLLNVNKTKAVDLLNILKENKLIDSFGSGKNTTYKKIIWGYNHDTLYEFAWTSVWNDKKWQENNIT